jgi:hypothetical protein
MDVIENKVVPFIEKEYKARVVADLLFSLDYLFYGSAVSTT